MENCAICAICPICPIQIVIPGAPGDALDIAGRLIIEELGKTVKVLAISLNL